MATFPSITPTYGQQKRSAPNTRTVRFADGYEHRILFGLAAHQNPKIFNLTFNVSETMANSFEESFKGIIKGTMSVSDAFRNMLNRIADHFLDTAARMLANQFQQGILGLLGGLFNPLNSARLGAQATAMTGIPSGAALPVGSFGISGTLANVGTAQKGKSYLVGERGAEIFTPGVTGTVSPNSAMGGTNIVVNVDASGSSVAGNNTDAQALGAAIGAAVQAQLIKEKRPGGLLTR